MNIDFDKLKYSLTGEYEEVMLEKQLEEKDKEIERLHSIIKEVRECVNHYAIENDDYTKLYSAEEQDILKLLDKES